MLKKKSAKHSIINHLVDRVHGDLDVSGVGAGGSGSLNSHGSQLPVAVIKLASEETLVVVGQSVVVRLINVETGESLSDLVSVGPLHGGLVAELDKSAGSGINHLSSVRQLALEGLVLTVVGDHQSAVVVDDPVVVPLVAVDTQLRVLVLSSAVESVTVQSDGNGVGTGGLASEHLVQVVVGPLVVGNVVRSAVRVNGAGLELLLAVVVLPGDVVVVVLSLVADGVGSSVRQSQTAVVNTHVLVLSLGGRRVVVDNVQVALDVDKHIDSLQGSAVDVLLLAKVQVVAVSLHGEVSVVVVSLGVHLVQVVRVGPLVVGVVVVVDRVVVIVVTVVAVVVLGEDRGNEGEGGDRELHSGSEVVVDVVQVRNCRCLYNVLRLAW